MDQEQSQSIKFTVITISYNSANTIQKCIDSVQTSYESEAIQHCFIDGGSNDGTVEIIRSNLRKQDTFISEPDNGISDAFNKGIALSKGIYIHILNSDDWSTPDFWQVMWNASKDGSLDVMHSDLHLYFNNKKYKEQKGSPDYHKFINYAMRGIFHPSMVVKKEIYERVGKYSLKQKSTMDLEWLQRAYDHGVISKYIPGAVVNFATGSGLSFTGNLTVSESVELAKNRKVNPFRIILMKYGKSTRIYLHSYYAKIRQRIFQN